MIQRLNDKIVHMQEIVLYQSIAGEEGEVVGRRLITIPKRVEVMVILINNIEVSLKIIT